MKRLSILAVLGAAIASVAMFVPAAAQAGVKQVAKAECRAERADDPAEFEVRYGGSGEAAIKRCVRDTKREAKAECKADLRSEPQEFALEYGGSDSSAIRRCMRDELT